MREIDISFYAETFSTEELLKLKNRKIQSVSQLDGRSSKNAAKSRTKFLHDIKSIDAALKLQQVELKIPIINYPLKWHIT